MTGTPLVVGLDLSLTATGIAASDGHTLTFRTDPDDGDWRLPEIRDLVSQHSVGAHLVVIEDLPKHAHSAGITGMVHGAIRTLLLDIDVPYALVPPSVLKKYATGNGSAPKPDLRMELYKRTGLDIKDDNQVDAWWLRAMGIESLTEPLIELPKPQRAMLDRVDWSQVRVP